MTKSGFSNGQLQSLIERIERLEEEKAALAGDIKEVYAEAKGFGFDVKIMRMVIRVRKLDGPERQEQEALLDMYLHALGMAPEPVAARAPASRAAPKPAPVEAARADGPDDEPEDDEEEAEDNSEHADPHDGEREPAPLAASDHFEIPEFLRRT